MTDRGWKWVIRAAVLWYCLMAILYIRARPGLQYDEGVDVRGAVHLRHSHEEIKLQHAPGTWLCLGERCFPLMSTPYTGAVMDYICLPLFALFGPSADLVRLVAMMLGALGILGIATLLSKQVGYAVAAATAWVMAIHPSYLDMTVFDNVVFGPWMAAFGLLCLASSAYLERRTSGTAFWVGVTLGLGIWARANYVWLLGALLAALAPAAGRRLLLPFRHWACIAIGAIVGGLPFLAYQAVSGGGTWAAADVLSASGGFLQRVGYRLTLLPETLLSDGEHRRIWGGPPSLSAWQLWLFPAVIALSCAICIAIKPGRSRLPRVAALTLLILTGAFFSTNLAIAEHHIVTLVPIAAIVVVLAGWELLPRFRWARAVLIAVAAVYAASALYWQFAALAGLRRTGGVGVWSDAVFPLTEFLSEDFPGREIRILDWGLENGVYVLSDGRVKTLEIFWGANTRESGDSTLWSEEIRRGGVFLLNGPQNRQIPAATIGFLKALAEGRPLVKRTVIPQRSGIEFAEVIEVTPDTLGKGPEPPPDPAGPAPAAAGVEEVRAADNLTEAAGFYVLEKGVWRWTARDFSLTFSSSRPAAGFSMRVNVPEVLLQKAGTVTLGIRCGDHDLGAETFSKAGDYTVTRSLEPGDSKRFDFHLDKALPPSPGDARELGIIFVGARLDLK